MPRNAVFLLALLFKEYDVFLSQRTNTVVELVIFKVAKFDTIVITIYRPPGTSVSKWKQAIDKMTSEIKLAQSHGKYRNIFIFHRLNLDLLFIYYF